MNRPDEPVGTDAAGAWERIDIRCGVVVRARHFPEARRPAIKLEIDFGPGLGRLQSSAQLTRRYRPEELEGREVLAAVNLGPRRIAGYRSDVLVLGLVSEDDPADVVLIGPDRPGMKGRRLA
ncbi:MAG: tRNA-binding protein [Candidatus Dormibacteria bacterium]